MRDCRARLSVPPGNLRIRTEDDRQWTTGPSRAPASSGRQSAVGSLRASSRVASVAVADEVEGAAEGVVVGEGEPVGEGLQFPFAVAPPPVGEAVGDAVGEAVVVEVVVPVEVAVPLAVAVSQSAGVVVVALGAVLVVLLDVVVVGDVVVVELVVGGVLLEVVVLDGSPLVVVLLEVVLVEVVVVGDVVVEVVVLEGVVLEVVVLEVVVLLVVGLADGVPAVGTEPAAPVGAEAAAAVLPEPRANSRSAPPGTTPGRRDSTAAR
jgi:hypothetical protein